MTRCIAAFLCCVAFVATAQPETTFDPAEIRVPAEMESKITVLISTVTEALTKKGNVTLTGINDLGSVGRVDQAKNLVVTFGPPEEISRNAQRISWKAPMTVTNMPRIPSATRLARLVFSDGSTQSIRYVLTTRSQTFAWTATSSARKLISPPNSSIDLSVVTTGDVGTNLRIDGNSLHETSNGSQIDPAWVQLAGPTNAQAITVPESTRTTVTIRFLDNIPNGNYVGSIFLAVDESTETKGVEIAFSRSRTGSRWGGAGLILLGILFSFFGGSLAKNIIATGEALAPAVRLRELAEKQVRRIMDCDAEKNAPLTISALLGVKDSLSVSALRAARFVPGWFVSPLGGPQLATAAYSTYLQEKSNRLAALGFLIDHGICKVAAKKFDPHKPSDVTARENAFTELDSLSVDPSRTPAQLSVEIPKVISRYDLALNPPPAGAMAAAGPAAPLSDRPTMESLFFRINFASMGAWTFAMIATLVLGYAVLIASNQGFGVEMDYIKCFLWGLGVQVAGQQLSQLTPASVSSTLGFRAPAS